MELLLDTNLWTRFFQKTIKMNFRTFSGYFIICLVIISYACSNRKQKSVQSETTLDNNTETVPRNKWVFDSLTLYQRVGAVEKDSVDRGMLIDLFLEYPVSAPDSIDLLKMQYNLSTTFLVDDKAKMLPIDAFKIQTDKSIESALENLREFDKWKESNEDLVDISNYSEARNTRIDTIINNIMIVSTATYDFLGGAHGAYNIRYYNFDITTGKKINEEALFGEKCPQKVAQLIRTEIKNRNQSSDHDKYISLLVDINKINPNDNFYITSKGIIYTYNQYEIAPYSQGFIEISLPYSKILPYIQDKYLLEIESIINIGNNK